jgi:hypothetical protein
MKQSNDFRQKNRVIYRDLETTESNENREIGRKSFRIWSGLICSLSCSKSAADLSGLAD